MSARFFEELIGKECDIFLRDDEYKTAVLVAMDGDWLKLDDDGTTLLVNCAQITCVSAEPEEDSRESRWGRRKK